MFMKIKPCLLLSVYNVLSKFLEISQRLFDTSWLQDIHTFTHKDKHTKWKSFLEHKLSSQKSKLLSLWSWSLTSYFHTAAKYLWQTQTQLEGRLLRKSLRRKWGSLKSGCSPFKKKHEGSYCDLNLWPILLNIVLSLPLVILHHCAGLHWNWSIYCLHPEIQLFSTLFNPCDLDI